jgi:hypothetical protein
MHRRHIPFIVLLIILSLADICIASTIKLAWDVVTTNEDNSPITDLAGYRITFCAGAGCTPSTDISPDLGLVTSYLHTGRTPGIVYRYKVRAIDTNGNASSDSNIVQATAPLGDLIAHWFRNESGSTTTATDGGWFGFNGTLCQGSTCPPVPESNGPTWVTGKINTALRCDGSDDNVEVAHSAALDLVGDMTIAFWLRLVSTTHLASADPLVLGKESASQPTPWLAALTNVSTPHLQWYHHTTTGDYSSGLIFTGYRVPINTWIYITMVRTMTSPLRTVTLYVNSVSTQSLTWPTAGGTTDPPQASGAPLRFCASHDRTALRYANIDLDEVRIYDYALSQTEITRLALAPGVPTGIRLR